MKKGTKLLLGGVTVAAAAGGRHRGRHYEKRSQIETQSGAGLVGQAGHEGHVSGGVDAGTRSG